eukprot:COSAG04_NODE_619_length_11882_cov_18.845880_9_plen_275_part_00
MFSLEEEVALAATTASDTACAFGWTGAGNVCFKLFGDGEEQGEPLPWADAEQACQDMGPQIHLASVTNAAQQKVVAELASRGGSQNTWIGLNDFVEEGSFVWSDDEPMEYTNWQTCTWSATSAIENSRTGNDQCEPNNWRSAHHLGEDAVSLYSHHEFQWRDTYELHALPYICAQEARPIAASGGEMNGCAGGRWVMGTPYRHIESLSYLPPTIVYGMYPEDVYSRITPVKITLNETVTTPAACAALVHRDHPTASAAEYSNVGAEWCRAVFDA